MDNAIALLILSVAILLFFGPIIVIVTILGKLRFSGVDIDITGLHKGLRFFVAFFGFVTWAIIYGSLYSLAKQAFAPSVKARETVIVTRVVTATPSQTSDSEIPAVDDVKSPTPAASSTPEIFTIEVTPTPSLSNSVENSSQMVLVPAGFFNMGNSNRTDFDYDPVHEIYVSDFYIDKYEVTNEQYSQCVEVGKCNPPKYSYSETRDRYYDDLENFGDHPVIYVTWDNAVDYCEWKGWRLPTEAEWEKAARWNPNSREEIRYPWGNEVPNVNKVNFNGQDTIQVGTLSEGESKLGLYDMAGNVLEWVNDLYYEDYYRNSPKRDPVGPSSGSLHVARGGSWISVENYEILTYLRYRITPNAARDTLGFRCAMSAPH